MKEFRCIIFTEQEVLTAVIERRRRAREQLPVGTIQGVTYDSTDGNAVFARIRIADDYGKVTDVVARTAELAAALVEYCLNRKIPMPTGSSKWIELINLTDLTLLMTVDGKAKRKPPAGGAARTVPGNAARTLVRAR